MDNYIQGIINPPKPEDIPKQFNNIKKKGKVLTPAQKLVIKQQEEKEKRRLVHKKERERLKRKRLALLEQENPQPKPPEKIEPPIKLDVAVEIWEKAQKEIQERKYKRLNHLTVCNENSKYNKCKEFEYVANRAAARNNMLKMMLVCYEQRDWHNLYRILAFALNEYDFRYLDKQIKCYLINAIQQDPVAIQHDALRNFLVKVKKLDDSLLHTEFMKNYYEFAENLSSDSDNSDCEDDLSKVEKGSDEDNSDLE